AIVDGRRRASCAGDDGRHDEFIALVARIRGAQAARSVVRKVLGLAVADRVVGFLHAVPALVAVHAEETATDRRDVAAFVSGKDRIEFFQRRFGAARRRIAAIEQGVQAYLAAAL